MYKKEDYMQLYLNGFAFENNEPIRICMNYSIPDYLITNADIYAYLQASFQKSGWENFLFTFSKI